MLENSRKRARKSKLEVREGVELEEATVLYMAASGIKIKEEPMIDVSPTTVLVKNTHIQDPFNEVVTPVIDHWPKMEFSVKIEVEECDETGSKDIPDDNEDETNDKTEDITQNNTKTDISATTSTIKQVKPNNFTFTSEKSVLKPTEKSSTTEFKEYVTNRPMMLKMAERLLKLNQIPDTLLAIGVRNYAGRVLSEMVRDARDTVLYKALEDWQAWHLDHSAVREAPLIYKCYICGLSWWYFHEFREHVGHHTTLTYFQVSLEPNKDECSLVSFQLGISYKDIYLPKKCCDRCGKMAKSHAFVNNDPYKCTGCKTTFSTCTQLKLHENQCAQYKKQFFLVGSNDHKCSICVFECNHESKLYSHMVRRHSVRSDMVITWDVKKCNLCSRSHILTALHICPRKTNNYGCNYCGRSFQKKLYKEIHQASHEKATECTICKKHLMTKCMESSHMLQHTDRFALMYKCIQCAEGRYYPDEFSIIHHTEVVHKRPFEKKFKYLEMVILPKQCLEKSSKATQNVNSVDTTKIISKDIASSKVFVPSVQYQTAKQPDIALDVVIKQETMSNELDIDTLCVADLSSIKTEPMDESKPHIQISDITSLQNLIQLKTEPAEEMEAEDLIIVDDKLETVEVYCTDEDSDSEFTLKTTAGKKLKKLTCICGYMDIPTRIKAHKMGCVATQAMMAAKRQAQANGMDGGVNDESDGDKRDDYMDSDDDIDDEKHNSDEDWGRGVPLERNSKRNSKKNSKRGLRYTCHCKKVFVGTLAAFRRHKKACLVVAKLKRDRRRFEYSCSKCDTEFTTLLKYCSHLNKTHYFQKFTCPQCFYTCDNFPKLTSHVMMHVSRNYLKMRVIGVNQDGVKSCRCKICELPIEKKDFFKHWESHLQLNTERVGRVEEYSEEEDKGEGGLVVDAPGSPPSPRNEGCSLYSADVMQQALEWLQMTIHEGPVDEKTCVFCARRFTRKNDSKRHVIEHLLQDAYAQRPRLRELQCQICGMGFVKEDKFKHHMREHASLPVYQCNLCGRSFSDSSNFCKHRKAKHGLSLMRCTVCDKKFHNPTQMERHVEMHERTKPIICDICGKVSYTPSAHRKHFKCAHERDRVRMYCPVCRASFQTLKNKWDHMWQVHKERKFKADCPLCAQGFRKYADVKSHVRAAHKMNIRLNANQEIEVFE